jgi:hypothetical protein
MGIKSAPPSGGRKEFRMRNEELRKNKKKISPQRRGVHREKRKKEYLKQNLQLSTLT